MLFSSIPFLYYFLPVVLIIYFAVPQKFKNYVLLVASLVFYASGEPVYLILMLVTVMTGYIAGLAIEHFRERKSAARAVLAGSVALLAVLFGYHKYADFFIDCFNSVTKGNVPLLNIALPIGISFYTFQVLSYIIDVYRGDVEAQKNIVTFATYVTMFPQLVAGPIVRYQEVNRELSDRIVSTVKVYEGIRRFIAGLAKKILLANAFAGLCDIFRASDEKSVLFYWIYAVSFTLCIYFDFSGYSDMAIGLGRILGFNFCENFNYPYISKSITEFWRRWHISLGTWFRDYVYIPLGGNRVSKPRWIFNIIVVWALTGLWHGAAWNFVIWGGMFAVILVFEKIYFKKVLDRMPAAFSHIYVILLVVISFVIFNADNVLQAYGDIGGMFGAAGIPLVTTEAVYYLKSYAVIFIMGFAGATPVIGKCAGRLRNSLKYGKLSQIFEPVIMVVLLLVCTAFLVDGSFNPFLYFRF